MATEGRVGGGRGEIRIPDAQLREELGELRQPGIIQQVIGGILPLEATAKGFDERTEGQVDGGFKGASAIWAELCDSN